VVRIEGTDVVCFVENTVTLGDSKGINLPGTRVDLPSITEQVVRRSGRDVSLQLPSFGVVVG